MSINTNFSETYEQAVHFYQMGQLDHAKAICLNILSTSPRDINVNHFYGLICYETGDIDTAIKYLKKTTSIQPKFAEAHSNLGNAYQEQGKLDKAIACHRKSLSIKNNIAEVHYNLGRALALQGKHALAIPSYEQAIKLKPDYFEAHNNLGNSLKDIGDLDKATDNFRKALEIRPRDTEIYSNLSTLLVEQERFDEAGKLIRRWLETSQDNPEAHYMLGMVMMETNYFSNAIKHLKKSLSIRADHVDAYIGLAEAYTLQLNSTSAYESLQKALSLEPNNTSVLTRLATLQKFIGEKDQAIKTYKKVIEIDPKNINAYIGLASLGIFDSSSDEAKAMQSFYLNKKTGAKDRMFLAFSLAKLHEESGLYEKSFNLLMEGNKLKRATFNYHNNETVEYFDTLKTVSVDNNINPATRTRHIDHTPIFIVGMPRSGTSLIEQILASHQDIYGAGEVPYLQHALMKQFDSSDEYETGSSLVKIQPDMLLQIANDYMEQLVDPDNTASHIVDKSMLNFQYLPIIVSAFPDAKIIHCKRDPMDNCFSIYKHNFKGTHRYAYDMTELGKYYLLYDDLMHHWHNAYPGRILDIEYENLVGNQEKYTRTMLEYCDLEWDEACLSFHKTKRQVNTASTTQVRKPIYKSAIQFWHHYETQLEPLREALGYQ